jgi:lycopene cyclase domain-containing protein
MKEYTLIAVCSVAAAWVINFVLKTKLFSNKKFWIFWSVMFTMFLIVNGYLTWRPIVIYGETFYLRIRLFTIPVEDFLFGFGLITLNITIWEFLTKKYANTKNSKS